MWVIAVFVFVFGFAFVWRDGPDPFFGTHYYNTHHPLANKHVVALAWTRWGHLFFLLFGFVGFCFASTNRRIALSTFVMSMAIPAGMLAWYSTIPRGPEIVVFQIGNRTISVHWKLKPRFDRGVLYFDARNTGPYKVIGPGVINSYLITSLSSPPLAERIAQHQSQEQFIMNSIGLECKATTFKKRNVRLCVSRKDGGQIKTLITCERGYCFHQFNHGELRLSLHYGPGDWKNWRQIEQLSVELLDEKTTARR